jgi:hypothetical protein
MKTFWSKCNLLAAAALLTAGFSAPVSAQVTCSAQAGTSPLSRLEGNTELLGDIVLVCTGGTPTPAGQVVRPINITVDLNTNLTSKITSSFGATNFSEALLLVDEPNKLVQVSSVGGQSNTLLNCGQDGAPDNGPSGPAVCSIVSTGVPTQTYDGTPFANGSGGICNSGINGITVVPGNNYGCGRPNAFQGRMTSAIGNNVVVFDGVPFDPPGAGIRVLRITNLRGDAPLLKASTPISAVVSLSMGPGPTITFTTGGTATTPLEVGFTQKAMSVSTPELSTVRVQEEFASAWKVRNVANTVANAIFMAGKWVYVSPNAKDPAQAAQNIPGIGYQSEDGFQWQNNTTNAPPNPNPPAGFGLPGYIAADANYPLNSLSFGGINTGINADGVSSAGTRIALSFKTASSVTVPSVVYLHQVGSPSTTTGVMVLTSTDNAGAGPFSPGATTTIHNGGMAVYEVLYADPFAIEYADIECTLAGFLSSATVTANLAPFYTTPAAAMAEPATSPIPRFTTADSTAVTISASIFGLIFSFF